MLHSLPSNMEMEKSGKYPVSVWIVFVPCFQLNIDFTSRYCGLWEPVIVTLKHGSRLWTPMKTGRCLAKPIQGMASPQVRLYS